MNEHTTKVQQDTMQNLWVKAVLTKLEMSLVFDKIAIIP